MKRLSGAMLLLAVAGSGCMSTEGGLPAGGTSGAYMSQAFNNRPDIGGGNARLPIAAPGMVGPYGQSVAMTAPAAGTEVSGDALARAMLAQSVPPEVLQQIDGRSSASGLIQAHYSPPNVAPTALIPPPGMVPPGGLMAPPGVSAGGNAALGGLPMTLPGSIAPPGLGTPAMGAIPGTPNFAGGPTAIPGAVAAVGALTGGPAAPFGAQRTSVRFVAPSNMKISWFAPKADGKPGFGSNYLDVPGRYNFLQACIYRLKLSEIPQHPGVELYPTLEVVPTNAKTAAFLAHSSVPVSFTEEDFDQVKAGNYVVKVIYLPDPQFQDLAATGPDEVVSSRLEPGVDPITEAARRGSILAVVRLGNIDLEAPNTPAMDAPPPGMQMMAPPAGMMPGMGGMPAMAGRMVPYNAMGPRMPMMPAMPQQMRQGNGPMMLPPVLPPTGSTGPTGPVGKATTSPVQQAADTSR